ncbi:hypothetical protein K491DRAFT_775295 [Lophiostoma macrostomum CBS 122681]|uniref:Uncharacterized protein n=1 Tax=Lophiostoma macrostomum CBS 122681 TaxID=1314788 RepID=A0A6A6TML1_9PLEO|nr:hypothetical protein K491DRAFT_775295 [Lophiostoma macrostomum CBS 122681]
MPYRLKDKSYFPRYFRGVRPEFQALPDTMDQDDYDNYFRGLRQFCEGVNVSAQDTIIKESAKLQDRNPGMKTQDWANKEADLVEDWRLAFWRSQNHPTSFFITPQRTMSSSMRQLLSPTIRIGATGHRGFATSSSMRKIMGSNPDANQPDSINKDVRKDTPNTDSQSNASKQEDKSGDNHPAKQPDDQQKPTRSTCIGGQTDVPGGRAGEKYRTDKQ